MEDTWRCKECEALITQEWDLCEDCHSDWIGWLERTYASSHGHTPDIDDDHLIPQ